MSRSEVAPRLASVVFFLGLFCTLSLAQPPRQALNPVDEAAARRNVNDQKAEADVKTAIQDAERQAKSNREKAVSTLKSAMQNIDLSTSISSEARKNLVGMLTAKIDQIGGKAGAVKVDKKAELDKWTAESNAVSEGIQKVVKLKKAGLNKDADREIAALAKAYPNNPSIIVLQGQDSFSTRVEDALEFSRQQDKRITIAMRNVDESSLPAIRDIELPKDWKEKTKRRTEVRMSEKERKIVESLNRPVTVDWNNKMLEEALQEISNQIDQNLFIDKKSLTDLGIDLTKTVSLQGKGIAARTALRQVLMAQGLTFVVKDDAIQVVTIEKARDMLVTRVYYLGDIAQGGGPFGNINAGPLLNFQNTMNNVELIMKAIQSSIDPMCWKSNGGPCTITFHYPTMSIIVRASAEVHSSIGSSFNGGR